MSINLKIPDIRELKPRITVFGSGGAGGNAVNNMISSGLQGVDFVVDLRQPWPWRDGTVEEAFCSHVVEHLTPLSIARVDERFLKTLSAFGIEPRKPAVHGDLVGDVRVLFRE